MSKGTPSFGKRRTRNHLMCPRCGKMSYHKQSKRCSACAFPEAKKRTPRSPKAIRRTAEGNGRMRHMKKVYKKSRSGFKEEAILSGLRN